MKSFKTKTISVLNQKGGVGKTTSAVNIASFLAITETPVLIIDMDPQGNASTGLGVGNQKLTIYDLLINNKNINSAIQKTEIDFLEIIPSKPELLRVGTVLICPSKVPSIVITYPPGCKNGG